MRLLRRTLLPLRRPTGRPTGRPAGRSIAAALTVVLAVVGGSAYAAVLPPGPTTGVPAPSPVDPYAPYVGQSTCDPTAKPGAAALLQMAMSHYRVGRNTGITRGCTVGGVSEHKEGRAFDWGLSVDNPAEKAAGDAFTHWLTAPGPDGRPGYNARRLGVMYVIWNRQIWYASSASTGWRAYYGASPHTDHVHVSMSWNGAYKRTSWWTGSLVAQRPIGVLDSITTTDRDIQLSGWALDPDTADPVDVHVYVDGVGVSIKANLSRPDIAAIYGRGDRHGFSVTLPQTPGPHQICTYAIDSDPTGNTLLDCRTVFVVDRAPIGSLDAVTTTQTSLTVSGWTLDPDTTSPNQIHLYVDGVGVAVVADRPRPDVGAVFRRGDLHGFSHTVQVQPGRHDLCVYGINTGPGRHTLLSCRSVQVGDLPTAAPLGVLDAAVPTPIGINLSGWTLDPDTTEPTDVRVDVDGVPTRIRADLSRPDIAQVFGKGDRHGFAYAPVLPAGRHTVCTHALNTAAGPSTPLGCRDVTIAAVAGAAPYGAVDALVPSARAVTAFGWVLDPDTTAPTTVAVSVDGVPVVARAELSRPDVAAAFARGDRHGFGVTVPAAPGTRTVCVHAMDAASGGPVQVACRSVVVPA